MDASKFLIVGSGGQLALALQKRWPEAKVVGSKDLDISDDVSVEAFDFTGVAVILNAAAYTNVDGAELPEGRIAAWKVNANGVANLAQAAIRHDLTLVDVSTDYVWDGLNDNHDDDEPLSPLGVYGQSKAAGEIATSIVPKHYLLRTSWVIGDGKNFVRTMISLASKNILPTVVADQIGRLTFTETLVEAIEHLLGINAPYGNYNVSNDGEPASWADITREIFKDLGREDLTVADTTTAEYFAGKENVSPRPLHSSFNLAKIKASGLTLRDWREDLKSYIANEKEG
ncbi:MAG TPA: NAD(P)-dependent oxidoreductase [Candidatus Saccharimonadales bacterium]